MKTLSTCLFIVLCALQTEASAPDSLADSSQTQDPITRTYLTLLYDPGLSMMSGAENILALHYGITRTEDHLLGVRWFSEGNFFGKAGGILARFAKLAIVDTPIDYFSVVLAHEYYGHGARYREFDIENIHYAFDLPPPYGNGGGQASANITGNVIGLHELLGIWQGGVEVHSLLNRRLGLRWMATRSIHYREALQYFWSWQIRYSYIQDATEDLTSEIDETDPRAYVRILNRANGYPDPAHPLFTVKQLKSRTAIDLVNPFVVFALFTALKTYLWEGNTSSTLPAIHLGQVTYLPLVRTGLTPFGLEYHLENYLSLGNITSLIDLRLGDHTFHTSWGGIGVACQNIYAYNAFSADVNLDVWRQPGLRLGGIPGMSKGGGLGGSFSIRGYYDLNKSDHPMAAVVELGYKSTGFLEGYPFDASPLFRIGIGIRL